MSNKYVWVVGGGHLQVPMIEAARSRGYKVLVTDANKECPGSMIADEFAAISTYDIPSHMQYAKKISKNLSIKAVVTCGADVARTVWSCQQALDLRMLPETITKVNILNNKLLYRGATSSYPMSKHLSEYNPDVVLFAKLENNEIVVRRAGRDEKYSKVDFPIPAIVKPPAFSASRGVKACYSQEEVESAAKEAIELSGDLGRCLIESLMVGSEHSVEYIFDKQYTPWFNIVDRVFGHHSHIPYGGIRPESRIELGHINPSKMGLEERQKVWVMVNKIREAFKMDSGIIKVDAMRTADGLKILETATRLSGGFDCQKTSPMAFEASPIDIMLSLSLGTQDYAQYEINGARKGYAACHAILPREGMIESIDTHTDDVIFVKDKGFNIDSLSNCADRVGFAFAMSHTYDGAWAKAKKVAASACNLIRYGC